jgi:hypothetical protein
VPDDEKRDPDDADGRETIKPGERTEEQGIHIEDPPVGPPLTDPASKK